MKNQWLTFFQGRVKVRIIGSGLERFINQLTRSGLSIWNVKQHDSTAFTFYMGLQHIHQLRHAARKHECHISFLKGEGVPFLFKRAKRNSGFFIGACLFLAVALVLSNITWGIRIEGASPATEHKIRKELERLDIKIGTSHWLNDHPETIQRKLTERLDNITWIGVELKGTTFHFQVVEKNEPKKGPEKGPRQLVAKKKAVIADLFVEKGKPIVKVNQYVQPGQLLVSGIIGNNQEQKQVAATGKVWGRTWYQSDVEFPLKSNFQVFNGEEKIVHYLHVYQWSFPIWGFGKNTYPSSHTEWDERDIYLFGWKAPISYVSKTIRTKEAITRTLTKAEAVEEARNLAKMDVKTKIPDDARIEKEYILHEEVENGKVTLKIHFQVIENIAEEKPISQGD